MKSYTFIVALALTTSRMLAAYTEEVNGITWSFTVSNYEATLYSDGYGNHAIPSSTSGAITIPSTLGGYPVTSIGKGAFYGCDRITSVIKPDTVTDKHSN